MKLFGLAACILVLVPLSCSKMESGRDSQAISFEAYTGRDIVKANVSDVTSSNLSSFKIASYLTGTATQYFLSDETATKQSSGNFTTATTYFWPVSGNLDFFAYKTAVSTSVSNTSGTASLSYAVPSDASDDLVVASAINCGSKAVQPLTFSHALAKIGSISFKAKTGDASAGSHYKYVIEDLSVEAKGSATFTFNSSSWSTPGGSAVTYRFSTMASGSSTNFLGNATKTLEISSGVKDQLALLPQTVKIKIKYSVWYSPLDNPAAADWMKIMDTPSTAKEVEIAMEKGKAYNVTLQLPNDGTAISFSVQVSDWLDESFSAESMVVSSSVVQI